MAAWVTLPPRLVLEHVQATMNVIIAVLSTLTIFTASRSVRQIGGRLALTRKGVHLPWLMSLGTIGDALDLALLLRTRLFLHWRVLFQAIVVILFTLTTIFSGPITKASLRRAHSIIQTDVDGSLANWILDSMQVPPTRWNEMQRGLDLAGFPHDQLLDFVPEVVDDWVYRSDEWNNTWSLDCKPIEVQSFHLNLSNDCTSLNTKFSGSLQEVIMPLWDQGNTSFQLSFYIANETHFPDTTWILYSAEYSVLESPLRFSLAAFHRSDVPLNHSDLSPLPDASQACSIGNGSVMDTSYNRIDCEVKSIRGHLGQDKASNNVAYPSFPVGGTSSLVVSLVAGLMARADTRDVLQWKQPMPSPLN